MKIKLVQFEGPLDLLLHLIEEDKLDITDISLASVTEQFLRHLRGLEFLKPHDLADWLVVAAKLLVIKSRALMPTLPLDEEDVQAADSLAWQLYQYRRYKEAARLLSQLDSARKQGWSRASAATLVERTNFYPDPSVTPAALRDALRFIQKTLEALASVPKKILGEVVTITEKIEHLQKMISEKVELKLRDLLNTAKSKTEVIVTFLALLELVKQQILSVDQQAIFSEIIIKRK